MQLYLFKRTKQSIPSILLEKYLIRVIKYHIMFKYLVEWITIKFFVMFVKFFVISEKFNWQLQLNFSSCQANYLRFY